MYSKSRGENRYKKAEKAEKAEGAEGHKKNIIGSPL
jgi:hypothetical protein